MKKAVPFGALLIAAAFPMLAAPAWAVDIATHRAVYSMKLLTSRSGSDVTDVRGKMYIEWLDACDGWTVTQRVSMTFVPRTGGGVDNDFSFSSWEAKDGERFRYTMRTTTAGQVVEEVEGRAKLGADGESGLANFTLPEQTVMELPPGTVFPTEHLFDSMAAALAGERVLVRTLFSGTGMDSLNEVTAFISPAIAPGTRALLGPSDRDAGIMGLADMRTWLISMAYFPFESQDAEPEFEVHYRIAENGVAAHLDLDYGDFSLRAVLDHLEIIPPPACD